MAGKGLGSIRKAMKSIKDIDMKEFTTNLKGGTEIFEKFRTDLVQIQKNQLEFEAYLQAILHNQKMLMADKYLVTKYKDMKDFFEEDGE